MMEEVDSPEVGNHELRQSNISSPISRLSAVDVSTPVVNDPQSMFQPTSNTMADVPSIYAPEPAQLQQPLMFSPPQARTDFNLSGPQITGLTGTPTAPRAPPAEPPSFPVSAEQPVGHHEGGGGMFGWLKDKARSGMEGMITTLDPGMTTFLKSGGDIHVTLTSATLVQVEAVSKAFQAVFGMATVSGVDSKSNIAPQPVGFSAGVKGADNRIDDCRQKGLDGVFVSMEGFIVDVLPDKWFETGCVLLVDKANSIRLEVFTTAIPVPGWLVEEAQKETPADFGYRWSGLAVTCEELLLRKTPPTDRGDLHTMFTGVSRATVMTDACLVLAGLYKRRLEQL